MDDFVMTENALSLIEIRSVRVFHLLGEMEFDFKMACSIAPGDIQIYVTRSPNGELRCRSYPSSLHFRLDYWARERLEEKAKALVQRLIWKVEMHGKKIIIREDACSI